jgi:serine/threonine-protein kinase
MARAAFDPERWPIVEPHVDRLIDLPPAERAAALDALRITNADIAADVEAFFVEHDVLEARAFLDQPTLTSTPVMAGPAPPAPHPGDRVGPYQLETEIGVGGMGRVFRARDTRLGRLVAIKFIRPEFAANEGITRRFAREARMISMLSHPHVCALYDIAELDGTPYLVMEHIEGQTLAARLSEGAIRSTVPEIGSKRISSIPVTFAQTRARDCQNSVHVQGFRPAPF